MTNAVSTNGINVTVAGTAGADTVTYVAGQYPTVNFNGVLYTFGGASSKNFTLNGAGGRTRSPSPAAVRTSSSPLA